MEIVGGWKITTLKDFVKFVRGLHTTNYTYI